ncbi:MAG: cytochrome c oxidase accessory protein CcoG [Phycisphaerales bacterium JB038]
MSATDGIPQLDERVLSTLNSDGSRRWMRPRPSPGRFLNARRLVGYLLILLFTALPYLRLNGKPMILLDIPAREFTFFGKTFLPTDTLLLALMLLMAFVTVFLLTALLGRVWCGWGCPQTVYMELIYRPVERLFEGRHYRSSKAPYHPLRRIGKYLTFLLISMFLAHTFLAYFVGVEQLVQWVRQSPFEHPKSFLVMANVTGLIMLDFCYLREQVCTLMCPYGRFQSVLLDQRSLIISYDEERGEPRGPLHKQRHAAHQDDPNAGDCIDCKLCVATCPTGIDIRQGLQMECIACAQCIDACDSIMDHIGKPRGLIRYSSQEAIQTGTVKWLRPRVVLYPLILIAVATLFVVVLSTKASAEVTFLRNRATPYRLLDDGRITNVVMLNIINRDEQKRTYDVELLGQGLMETAELPLRLEPGESRTIALHVALPMAEFNRGRARVTLRVSDDADFSGDYPHFVLGPLYGGADADMQEDAP